MAYCNTYILPVTIKYHIRSKLNIDVDLSTWGFKTWSPLSLKNCTDDPGSIRDGRPFIIGQFRSA